MESEIRWNSQKARKKLEAIWITIWISLHTCEYPGNLRYIDFCLGLLWVLGNVCVCNFTECSLGLAQNSSEH